MQPISSEYCRVVFPRLGTVISLLEQLAEEHASRVAVKADRITGTYRARIARKEAADTARLASQVAGWLRDAMLESDLGWSLERLTSEQAADVEAVRRLLGVKCDDAGTGEFGAGAAAAHAPERGVRPAHGVLPKVGAET